MHRSLNIPDQLLSLQRRTKGPSRNLLQTTGCASVVTLTLRYKNRIQYNSLIANNTVSNRKTVTRHGRHRLLSLEVGVDHFTIVTQGKGKVSN